MDLFNRKKRSVASLDLSLVKKKATERNGWTQEQANEAEADYRRFLYLLAKSPNTVMVPWTNDLDKFWHEHILDTRRYSADCEKVFGRFIHHDPHIRQSPAVEARARQDTRTAFQSAFMGRSASSDPSMAWLVAGAAGIAALGISQNVHARPREDEKQQRRSNDSGGIAGGCSGSTAPTAVPATCPPAAADCPAPAASCDGGAASCGGGGCGGGG